MITCILVLHKNIHYVWRTINYAVKNTQNHLNYIIYTIRGSGGWDAWHKEIICEVFGDKKTTREIEDKYIRELQPSCNINLAVKDYDLQKQKQREKYELDKSYKQQYYKNNIERIKQYQYNKRNSITETPQSTH